MDECTIGAASCGVTALGALARWARLRCFRGRVTVPTEEKSEEQQRRLRFHFGAGSVLELQWVGKGVRIVLDGQERFQVPAEHAFESPDSYPMPDGSTLSIEYAPDFLRHRVLVVCRDGEELKPIG